MTDNKIIWQYWETKNYKPAFIDGLHEIAKKNSGAEVVLVTPETVHDYIPHIPDWIFRIKEMAHKADMIRTLLVYHHGGMWLDSDAIVLSNLGWLFKILDEFEFVGFNETGSFDDTPLNVRINCFLSRPKTKIMMKWIQAQHSKFPKLEYTWTELGTDILDPIIMERKQYVRLLPFDYICPVRWYEVSKFTSKCENYRRIVMDSHIVMLSNKSLQKRNPALMTKSINDIAVEDNLIGAIIKKSIRIK